MTELSEGQKEALLNLLISITYRSRPVRWRLRRTHEQEKSKLEHAKSEMEFLISKSKDNKYDDLSGNINLNEVNCLIAENEKYIEYLSTLIEALRPAVYYSKDGIEDLKKRNDKIIKAYRKIQMKDLDKNEKTK